MQPGNAVQVGYGFDYVWVPLNVPAHAVPHKAEAPDHSRASSPSLGLCGFGGEFSIRRGIFSIASRSSSVRERLSWSVLLMPKKTLSRPMIMPPVSEQQYRAIGHVSVQWAMLEIHFDWFLRIILAQPATQHLGPAKVAFKRRLVQAREATRLLFHGDDLAVILKVLEPLSCLRDQRDAVVHGQWRIIQIGARIGRGVHLYSSVPEFKLTKKILTAEDTERLAHQISHAYCDLLAFTDALDIRPAENSGEAAV